MLWRLPVFLEVTMPKVRMASGKMKSYSYTPAGKKAAAKARKAAKKSKKK